MRLIAAFLMAMVIGTPAQADTGPFSNGVRYWPSISVSAPLQAQNGVWVKRRQTILTFKQRYKALFQLDSAFQSKQSSAAVLANVKLYPFGRSIVCTRVDFIMSKKGAVDDIVRDCFLDSNGDGIFEGYFRPKNSGTTSVSDYIVIPNPKRIEPVAGVKISRVEPGPYDILPDLHLSFQDRSILTGVEILICEGEYVSDSADRNGYSNCISPRFEVDPAKLPFSFQIFGARFLIKEKRGSELLFFQLDPVVSSDLYSRMG